MSTQIGMLTNSTQRQPGPSESTPPRKTPAAAATPLIAPHTPSALVRSLPSVKRGGQDRQPGGRHQRRADALRDAGADQHAGVGGEPAGERAHREQGRAGHQQAPASDQVGRASAEQQEPAVGDEVAAEHPLQALLGEAQVVADRRQRDVHDRGVDDVHELDRAQQQQREHAAAGGQEGRGLGARWPPLRVDQTVQWRLAQNGPTGPVHGENVRR